MRLIDADALTANVLKWLPPDPCGCEEKEFPFAEDICVSMLMEIEEAPTIEPKIIRCENCDWWEKQAGGLQGRCALFGIYPTGAWYCANARKRGGSR